MEPLAIIQAAQREELVNEDGERVELAQSAALTPPEIEAFARGLPCPLPDEIRRLLAHCRGFSGVGVELVDFTGRDLDFEHREVFPHGLPIAADGYGNFWVVDLQPASRAWAPIYYACHDAPAILFQSPSLEHFLEELFKLDRPPHRSAIDDVHEDRLFEVWRSNPGVVSREAGLASPDAVLADFARSLEPGFELVDLRGAAVGFGFSWGRHGPQTIVRRHGSLPLFAVAPPPRRTLFQRLFR